MVTKVIKNNAILRIITAIIIAFLFSTTFFYCDPRIFSLLLIIILGIILTTEWKNIFLPSSLLFWAIMPLYPVTPFLLLIALNESIIYRILIFYIFLIVFTFDSASYIIGNLYGQHKIIPSISPGKTWEGALGGYCITTFMVIFITNYQSLASLCLLNFIICTLAFAGDIFESYLKRLAKIKDSGNLLPGHGGFLDRFDAVIFVSYFFFFYKNNLLIFFTN